MHRKIILRRIFSISVLACRSYLWWIQSPWMNQAVLRCQWEVPWPPARHLTHTCQGWWVRPRLSLGSLSLKECVPLRQESWGVGSSGMSFTQCPVGNLAGCTFLDCFACVSCFLDERWTVTIYHRHFLQSTISMWIYSWQQQPVLIPSNSRLDWKVSALRPKRSAAPSPACHRQDAALWPPSGQLVGQESHYRSRRQSGALRWCGQVTCICTSAYHDWWRWFDIFQQSLPIAYELFPYKPGGRGQASLWEATMQITLWKEIATETIPW